MNFSDLSTRLEKGIIVWITLGFWIYLSVKNPIVFPIGLVVMASICLYEWFLMGVGKSTPLRMAGAAIIGFGFWTCYDLAHREPGVAFICLLVPITDTVAYFGGRLMGGPKLCPAISSSKNWAGFLSVVIGVPFLAFLYILPSLHGNGAKADPQLSWSDYTSWEFAGILGQTTIWRQGFWILVARAWWLAGPFR